MPDIACVGEDGRRTTLHQGVMGGAWALLTSDKAAADRLLPVARELLGPDVVPVWPAAEGLTDAILVRPDAHVGWRGEPDEAALKGWLTEVVQAR
ncbi:aromatic-ring hydroxylase C-terminal domain-containing protein [Fodinicola feengrottensis]|uniref:aromatic-ring hydroxylase C-terminal domain-containing protein n=1 Tax=Fodinicola feengrottensis TaxID=435914 RepID=UPI0036F3B793